MREGGDTDKAFALAAALNDMEGVHAQLLQYIADHPQPPESIRTRQPGPDGREVRELQQVQPDVADLVEPVIAVLARHGLLSASGGRTFPGRTGPALYRLSPLGETCLFLLRDPDMQRPENA